MIDSALITLGTKRLIETLRHNPFDEDDYKACWLDHMASHYSAIGQYGNFTCHQKVRANGWLRFKELKLCGAYTAWFQDFTEAHLEEFLSLSKTVNWDSFWITWADSRKSIQAIEPLRQLGFPITTWQGSPMHIVDLSDGFDGYLARMNARDRYNIRQKLRDAHRCELITYDQFDDIEPFFERAFELHIPYWRQKKGYSFFEVPEKRAFAVAWAKAMYPTGRLRLHGLKVDGELANLSSSFLIDDTMYWSLTINTGARQEVFPGLISLYLRMQKAVDEGATTFNMQYCELPFKRHVRTHVDERYVTVVTNPKSLKGGILHAYFQHKYKSQRLSH